MNGSSNSNNNPGRSISNHTIGRMDLTTLTAGEKQGTNNKLVMALNGHSHGALRYDQNNNNAILIIENHPTISKEKLSL